MKNVVYMLECRDGSLYTGWTNRLTARLSAHDAGTASKYTRSKRPVRCVLVIHCKSASQARSLEAQIKRFSRKKKLQLLTEDGVLGQMLIEVTGDALPFTNSFGNL